MSVQVHRRQARTKGPGPRLGYVLATVLGLVAGGLAAAGPAGAAPAGAAPAGAAPAGAAPAAEAAAPGAGPSWTVSLPQLGARGGPTAVLGHDPAAGTLTLAVTRLGQPVLEPGALGIITDQVNLSAGLRFLGRSDRRLVERYRTTVGKRLNRVAPMAEARFRFAGAGGARLDLVIRAARDGVAYRYELPQNHGAVQREASTYAVPAQAAGWLARWQPRGDYENPFLPATAGTATTGEYMHPALFETAGGYLLITESDLDGRYSGARLVHEAGSGGYRVALWDPRVETGGSLATPWRTMIVGDLGTVAGSTLVDDLAPLSRVADTSWIRPGSVFWSWLAGSREAGQSLKIQKTYVDYAAAHGWPYVLVDAGWYFDPNWEYDPAWETTSWIPELVRYARDRRVKVLTWVHYNELDTAEERASRLPLFRRWGVAGLKIDFMDSDAQERFRWYDQILPETAANHLLVNFHGSTLPHGIHRTWPHVMTMEAVHGGEKSSNLTTAHLTTLPFTRNVPGSMDYTPMAWHRANRPTSDAHELALSVLFESGQQNFAGRVEGYLARPEAERFLDQVPTAWDETRLLAGRPGQEAVFARRSGARWFLGGGYSGPARSVSVPLDLPAGRWLVDLVTDGAGDPAPAPAPGLVREPRVLQAGEPLRLDVRAEGGFAAIACRWRPGLDSCDRPVRTVPRTTVAAEPRAASALPGGSVRLAGRFAVDGDRAVTDVTLVPRPPAGWTVTGRPARARRLAPGHQVAGEWTVHPPAVPPAFGYLDLPVVATLRDGAGPRRLADEQTVQVHLWRPLPPGWSYLSDRPFQSESNGQGPVERDVANNSPAASTGNAVGLSIRRVRYGKGLGMAPAAPATPAAEVSFALGGACRQLVAQVGVDDEVGLNVSRSRLGGTVGFTVLGDGATLAESGTLTTRDQARTLTVDLTGVRTLTLRVTDGGDGVQNDSGSWGDAQVSCDG